MVLACGCSAGSNGGTGQPDAAGGDGGNGDGGVGSTLVFTNAPVTMTAGVCSPALTIQAQDSAGQPVVQTAPLDVTLGFNANFISGTQWPPVGYADPSCTTALPVTGAVGKAGYHSFAQAPIAAGSSTVTVYVIAFSALAMDVAAAATGYAIADQTETVLPGAALFAAVTGADTLGTSACGKAMWVRPIDNFRNTTGVAAATAVTLTGLGSATVYADATCTTAVASGHLTLPSSATDSAVAFYLKDSVSEHLSVGVTAPPLTFLYGVELWVTPLANAGTPIPPQLTITIPARPSGGTIINVPANGDLQAALNSANPGDTIVLQAGATYKQAILPAKANSGGQYISIVSSAAAALPPGHRVGPADAANMPKILTTNIDYAISSTLAANGNPPSAYYRLIGLEITMPTTTKLQYGLVDLKAGKPAQASDLPHHIYVESSYVHGTATADNQSCIAMGGAYEAVVDSYVADCHFVGVDAKAIGSHGPGPYKIANNYLEASTENVLFGGAPADYPNEICSDIEILHNTFSKPVSWNPNDAANFKCVTRNGQCLHWTVKNLLELKMARRVTVDGNILQYNWVDGQTGYALLITPRGTGTDYFAITEDISYTNNIIAHSMNGLNFSRIDGVGPAHSQETTRVLFQNNVLYDIGDPAWGGAGNSVLVLGGVFDHFTMNHNTMGFSNTGSFYEGGNNGPPFIGFSTTANIVTCGKYGFHVNGGAASNLDQVFQNPVMTGNVFIGCSANALGTFQTGNYNPADPTAVGFTTWAADSPTNDSDNPALTSGSPYHGVLPSGDPITRDIGVNRATLQAHLQ